MAVHISPEANVYSHKDITGESIKSVDQNTDSEAENVPKMTRVQLAQYEDSFSFQGLRKKMAMVMTVESEEWTVRLM